MKKKNKDPREAASTAMGEFDVFSTMSYEFNPLLTFAFEAKVVCASPLDVLSAAEKLQLCDKEKLEVLSFENYLKDGFLSKGDQAGLAYLYLGTPVPEHMDKNAREMIPWFSKALEIIDSLSEKSK